MDLAVDTEHLPYEIDDDDKIARMKGTRVPLDSVLIAFQEGATPEEIVQQFPTVDLGDTYESIGLYLKYQDEFDHYLNERANNRKQTQQENQDKFDLTGIRDRLRSRQST